MCLERWIKTLGWVSLGAVVLQGTDLLKLDRGELERVRGKRVSLIFQEPGAALHKMMRVGEQIEEVLRAHSEAKKQVDSGAIGKPWRLHGIVGHGGPGSTGPGRFFFEWLTDPGLALRTGKFADIGKFKVPILRGLGARAPYFHNGEAKTLTDVVNFYNQRFKIGFTDEEIRKIVLFLEQT